MTGSAPMRHAILGPGGVGGLIGAVLAHEGHRVTLLVRPGSEKLHPPELMLQSPLGTISSAVHIGAPARSHFDVLWITVKATQLDEALAHLPVGLQIGCVVPLLNGLDHISKLRRCFGDDRVIPATISVESERVSPGQIVHRSPFARLRIALSGQQRLAPAVDALAKFGFDCAFVGDEPTLLWSKLVFLAPFALCTAAWRCPIGDVRSDAGRAAELAACVSEACAVASATGASVNADAVLNTIKTVPSAMRSSMEKDVSAGQPTELHAIAGPIIRGGQQFGISTSATERLVALIHHG